MSRLMTAPGAPADFYLHEAYAIPFPCKACGSQGFVAQVGLADWAGLECRKMLGQVVFRNPFGGPTIKDIGNGLGDPVHLRKALAAFRRRNGSLRLRGDGPQGWKA